MAKTATIYTTYKMSGDGETETYVGTTFTNTNSPGQSGYVNLSSGDNTLTPPPAGVVAKGLLIIPPAANIVAITLKGNAADTGVALRPNEETRLPFPDAGPGTIILNAASAIAGVRLIWY